MSSVVLLLKNAEQLQNNLNCFLKIYFVVKFVNVKNGDGFVMAMLPTADAHWRDSARPAKFFFVDAKAAFPLLLFFSAY